MGPLFFTSIPILAFKCLSPFLLPALNPESLTIINYFFVVALLDCIIFTGLTIIDYFFVVLLDCIILVRKSSGMKQSAKTWVTSS